MRTLLAIVLSAFVLCSASAQTPAPPLDPAAAAAAEASLHGYGDANRTCQEWTDSCRTCRRTDAGAQACSNIGIACQPKTIACVRQAEEKK